jgi:hypothetical protein
MLERLGEGLAVHSGETVAAHWVDKPVAEASTSGSSVVASGMEDAIHASTTEPYSGF